MVQTFGRVVVAAVALNTAVTLAQYSYSEPLEAREEVVPYSRRHVTREELFELDARDLDEFSELEAREPEPVHVPIFSNWNAGRKQRNQDRQRGKQERLQAEKGGSTASERRDLDDLNELEARAPEYEIDELEAREPEPEPLHIPIFSDWNAGRKQRNQDRQRGKQERLQAEKAAGISERDLESDLSELEAREPQPLDIPFFSAWNAGRKQRNQDRQKGKQERLQADRAGGVSERDLDDLNELEARAPEYEIDELEAREPEPEPVHVPIFSNWNAGRKQRNQDRQRGKQERLQAGGVSERDLDDLSELEARAPEYEIDELEAREPEPEPVHVPIFSNWNAGRKQRNQDRQRGKQERLQADKAGGVSERDLESDLNEFEAREPEPVHVPIFSNWNAGRKQRNQDRQRGKQERLQAEKAGGVSERDLESDLNEFEARALDYDLDELD